MTGAADYIESLELMGMQFGLERMRALLEALDHPERRFDAIHVVGSNGKSSTVRFCEALLEAEGVRSGSYSSPHITTFRERIRIGGEVITAEGYEQAVGAVQATAMELTQFEALTGAAFVAFAEAGVEMAVVEAGLGGRLDATNTLARSVVQVLTNISLEHADLLGSTRELIAREKLAVVPPGGRVVIGEPGWERTVPQAAWTKVVTVGGSYQDQNRAVARAAVEAALGRPIDPAPIERLEVPGRLEVRSRHPLEIWDGAHNPAGMQRLVGELPALLGDRQAVAVFAALAEKDVAGMISLLRTVCPTIIATSSSNPRALPADTVAAMAGGPSVDDPREALEAARVLAGPTGAVVVCGSLYLLHDLTADPFA
ncbi:MAG: dihydrofolate synthase / folylpolyglutamate synthase [Gaiellales bacterium]|jgi:dihydrofolate synthase/folylpolyglutamate synthase|nr:dihydrofolate synthase / folylpolyglutamate synthase [Gaiellales bacterium]